MLKGIFDVMTLPNMASLMFMTFTFESHGKHQPDLLVLAAAKCTKYPGRPYEPFDS